MPSSNNILIFIIMTASMILFSRTASAEISPGQPAPEFDLVDQYEKRHQLSGYRGNWVVLYFYPKDDTPGCTTEACNFRDDFIELQELNARVLGVSVDNTESHAKFAEKHGLPFPLLSDPDGEVAKLYGSLWKLGPIKIAKRHTFIIDPEGRLAKIYRDVSPDTHSDEVIADIRELIKREK
ncbi:MAG: peroxiredoxin [Gammaproteobacteria bacterium]|nr:peroxiredoxin [Gammaproteobacteria bacterium]